MKKAICILLLALLLSAMAGCKDGGASAPGGEAPQTPPQGDSEQTPDPPADGKVQFVYERPTEPAFAVPDNVTQQFVKLVRPFNTLPQTFSDVSELTDYTLFFAAAGYLDSSFIASGDNYTYKLGLDKFPSALRALFGEGAAFSDGYRNNDYEPYAIEGDTVVKYGIGKPYFAFYTFAVVALEDGYELWLLDLMDDNVMSDPALAELVEFGEADSITWGMLAPFWDDMQTNIYTLKKGADGNYYIAGFRYENYKNIEHYMI